MIAVVVIVVDDDQQRNVVMIAVVVIVVRDDQQRNVVMVAVVVCLQHPKTNENHCIQYANARQKIHSSQSNMNPYYAMNDCPL